MKNSFVVAAFSSLLLFAAGCTQHPSPQLSRNGIQAEQDEKGERDAEQRAMFVKQRLLHEYNMLKDPVTGKIPADIRQRELAEARLLPARQYGSISGTQGVDNLNTYTPAGPDNIGGRTRAVAFDQRYNGTTNKVIIAGSVSGGIFRSADGGATWTRVNPENDINNLTALAQDPNNPDTWYAGGGEAFYNSANGVGALYMGFGIWKSTDNGQTWIKLTRAVTDIDGSTVLGEGILETFDNVFDYVHKIYVNPVNSDVYICGHRRLIRSTDAGSSWHVVFSTTTPSTSDEGQMDVVGTTGGKLFLAVDGGLPDQQFRGIWTSASGNANSWIRIAGGNNLGVDSVDGWRGNDYTGNSKRIILAIAPSDQNVMYVTYVNGLSGSGSSAKPEADLYKYDIGTSTWTNLSANVPDFTGQLDGVDPFNVQYGYNLTLVVKPDNSNTVFLGGVNLFRSTSGFSNTSATTWIGGYGKTFTNLNIYGSVTYPNDQSHWSHPDIHNLAFDPSNANRAICANDGGIQVTDNIMATGSGDEPVTWNVLNNYQTLQYYYVSIDPGSNRYNFLGGAQDNGSRFYDGTGVFGSPSNSSQIRIIGGDGGANAIAQTSSNNQVIYCSIQFGEIYRVNIPAFTGGKIKPNGLTAYPGLSDAYGDFVTLFKLDQDNTDDLYYVNFNRLFRTSSASSVSSSAWTELTGVGSAVNPSNPSSGTNIEISALALSRGPYASSHALYIGTSNGRIFRLNDPRNSPASLAPVDITPSGIKDRGYISDIAVNPNDDNEVMIVASNYQYTNSTGNPVNTINIWWTNNAKSSTPAWHNAEGNLSSPSIRSCMIVVKKDASNNSVTEYYVGTSVGLYSVVDMSTTLLGGGSPTWVREGGNVLNYALVTSLAYRPQDNVLLVGTHGNGMYYAQTGTPDFNPNQNTGINDPVRNDKNFIVRAVPTLGVHDWIRYQAGNMYTIKSIEIQVHNLAGQLVYRKSAAYQDGSIDIQSLSRGAYVLTITSDDYKQQFVQKFVKD